VRTFIIMLLALLGLAGCATYDSGHTGVAIDRNAKWVMLPVLNHTDVPQAGLRAETITEGLLRSYGVNDLTRYPAALNQDTLFEPAERKVMIEAEKWARIQGARYAVYGAVDEWRRRHGAAHHGSAVERRCLDRRRRQERLEPGGSFGCGAEVDPGTACERAGSVRRLAVDFR